MADIVLLNKNGVPTTHEGVTELKVPTSAGGVQRFETPFSMVKTYFYYCRPSETEDAWEITDKWSGLGRGTSGILGGFGAESCEEYGYQTSDGAWAVGVLVSKQELTVGNTYTSDQLING